MCRDGVWRFAKMARSAHSCHSPTGRDAAGAARFAVIRRKLEFRASSNSHIADKAPFRCDCAKVRNSTLSNQSFLKPISS